MNVDGDYREISQRYRRRVVTDRVPRSLIKLGEWKTKIIGDDVEIMLLFTLLP